MTGLAEWTAEELEKQLVERERLVLYLYTPLCGTCQLGERMLTIVTHMLPALPIYKCNVNWLGGRNAEWKIESVPCLLFWNQGRVTNKTYAMQSVDELYKLLKPWET